MNVYPSIWTLKLGIVDHLIWFSLILKMKQNNTSRCKWFVSLCCIIVIIVGQKHVSLDLDVFYLHTHTHTRCSEEDIWQIKRASRWPTYFKFHWDRTSVFNRRLFLACLSICSRPAVILVSFVQCTAFLKQFICEHILSRYWGVQDFLLFSIFITQTLEVATIEPKFKIVSKDVG